MEQDSKPQRAVLPQIVKHWTAAQRIYVSRLFRAASTTLRGRQRLAGRGYTIKAALVCANNELGFGDHMEVSSFYQMGSELLLSLLGQDARDYRGQQYLHTNHYLRGVLGYDISKRYSELMYWVEFDALWLEALARELLHEAPRFVDMPEGEKVLMVRETVFLDVDSMNTLRAIGEGDISRGVAKVLEERNDR